MAKLVLEIEDKKLKFFKDIIRNFPLVKIEESQVFFGLNIFFFWEKIQSSKIY